MHASRPLRGYFDAKRIVALLWLPRSPSLNTTEQSWDALTLHVRMTPDEGPGRYRCDDPN